MSRVRSDKFTNRAATGPCTFTDGLTVTDTTGVAIGVTIGMGGIVAVGGTFSGNVSIAGTLTYEDVTNVDSTGIVTAGSGVKVTAGGVDVTAGGIQVIAGDVGIGTTNPVATSTAYDGALLHLGQPSSSAKGSQLKFTTGSSGHATTDGAYLAYYSNNHLYIYNREDEGISFGTNNTERVVFDSGGNVNITGITTASSFSDSLGTLRSLPVNSQTSAYQLVAADAGKLIKITTGGVVCPNGESFVAGDMITIMNESDSSQTVSTTGGSTLYWTADGSTGTRTLGPRGVATIVMSGTSAFYISGSGLS